MIQNILKKIYLLLCLLYACITISFYCVGFYCWCGFILISKVEESVLGIYILSSYVNNFFVILGILHVILLNICSYFIDIKKRSIYNKYSLIFLILNILYMWIYYNLS